MLDVVIRGGQVIDGSGADRVRADVGIRGGKVVEVGSIGGDAARVIDAGGCIVSPGFIDVHTHYDAQAFWDTTLSPSPLHGVTTVLGGNCGFSIAPLNDEAGPYLMRMLARVEGMPLASLEQAVPWDWRSTGDFLDRLDRGLAVNTGFLVGHSALRRVVMGPNSVTRECTPAELDAMRQLLRDGLGAGALGFSSSWSATHNDGEGRAVPSRWASADEVIALAAVCKEFPGTSLEFIPGTGAFTDADVDLMTTMSAAAERPLNWNVLFVSEATQDDAWAKLEAGSHARNRGGRIVALTCPFAPTLTLSFLGGIGYDAIPGWDDVMALPADQRVRALSDPDQRARLSEQAGVAGERGLGRFFDWPTKVIVQTFTESLRHYEGRTVADIAAAEGKAPFDALLDIACADGLRTTFLDPAVETRADWETRAKVWRDGRAMIGGSDAGAHLDLIDTFNITTKFLARAVREEQLLSLEEAVRMLAYEPAELYGLEGRGRLSPGAVADVVIFDPDQIGSEDVATRFDLPGGAGRLYAGARGVHRVLVAGEDIVIDGEMTDARPGRVLRSGTDTRTPDLG